jgi:pimeloyl-ACP methyl ester carboxylesterase
MLLRLRLRVSLPIWLVVLLATPLVAGELRLKNGTILTGTPSKLISLATIRPQTQGPTTVYNIVRVQTPWQHYYVPFRQIPDDGLNLDATLIRMDEFEIPQLKGSRSQIIQSLGAITMATPFDEFGRRRVSLQTERGALEIVQGITRLTPEYAAISAQKYGWDFGLGINQIPQETVLQILRNPVICKPDDPQDRMARARFCIQAGWYAQADAELETIASDFPMLTEQAGNVRQELRQLFGRDVLRELTRRRNVGQYQLAEQAARQMSPTLGAGVARDVERFLGELKQTRDQLQKVEALLGDLQAKLPAGELTQQTGALRTQLVDELDPRALGRLQPFLLAETDASLSAAEKLALAFSGWVLGVDGADTDLAKAHRLWDARFWAREYLRAEDPTLRQGAADHLRGLEGLGPVAMLRLLQHMPPPRSAEGIVPGERTRVEVPASRTAAPAIAYDIVLPPEYSPVQPLPVVIALPPNDGEASMASTAQMWCGTAEQPGWASRRGMIVIVPAVFPEGSTVHPANAAAHEIVLESLRDARLRFAVDADRVFLVGYGAGGDAAFDIALAHPDEFAGVVPVSGILQEYSPHIIENGQQTAWYILRGELGRDLTDGRGMTALLDPLFRNGAKYDLIYCLFPGRGNDRFADELPKIVDWMELQRRRPMPKEFTYRTLRQSDARAHWVTMQNLPRNYVLPLPPGERTTIRGMELEARVTEGNTLYVRSPAAGYRLRIPADLIDWDQRVSVHANGKKRYHDFVKPDIATMLDDLRHHGDRTRIAHVVLEF